MGRKTVHRHTVRTIGGLTPTQIEDKRRAEAEAFARNVWKDPEYFVDPTSMVKRLNLAAYGAAEFTAAEFNRKEIATQAQVAGGLAVPALHRVMYRSPTVTPSVAVGLAELSDQMGLDEDTLYRILGLDAETQAMDPEATTGRKPEPGSEAEKGGSLSHALGNISRPVFALLSAPYELVQATMRSTWDGIQSGDLGEALRPLAAVVTGGLADPEMAAELGAQATGVQYLAGLATDELSADLGEGWFPNGDVAERQRMAARQAAPLIHDHAWTLGRGIASTFLTDPESTAYNTTSGLIDMASAILLDPTIIFGKAAATGRAIQISGRVTGAGVAGARLGEAAEAARRVEAAQAELRGASWLVNDETLEAARQAHIVKVNLYTEAVERSGDGAYARDVEQLTSRIDEIDNEVDTLNSQRGRLPSRKQLEKGRQADDEMREAIDQLTAGLGDDGLDALTAKVVADAPDLPGSFTDAIFHPLAELKALPGSHNGRDAVLVMRGGDPLNLKSVDDAIDDPELASLVDSLGSSTRSSAARTAATQGAQTNSTYGDLIDWSMRSGNEAAVKRWLDDSGIDGITDIFRLNGGEGGAWWTSERIDASVWERLGHVRQTDEWRAIRADEDSITESLRSLREARTQAKRDLAAAQRRNTATARLAQARAWQLRQALPLGPVFDDLADARQAQMLRDIIADGMGVRRALDGSASVDAAAMRSFLVGSANDLDSSIGAYGNVPVWNRVAMLGDRAIIAGATLGASEALRAISRGKIQPMMRHAREALLESFIRMEDTPANVGRVQRLTGGKLAPETIHALLRSQSDEDVLGILGPLVGTDIVRPIGPGVVNSLPSRMYEITGGRANYGLFGKATRWLTDEAQRLGAISPRLGVHLNLSDPQGAAVEYRNYLDNVPGMDTDTKDGLVGRFLSEADEAGRGKAITSGLENVADALVQHNMGVSVLPGVKMSQATADALSDKLRQAVRKFEQTRESISDQWVKDYQHDAIVGQTIVDGVVVPLPGHQMGDELARGGIILPDIRELRDAIGRWGAATERAPWILTTRNFFDHLLDIWRGAMLFRVAYTARNIGEMHVRMALQGHSSVFTNPLGAAAMASAMNRKSITNRKLLARFARHNKLATGRVLGEVDTEDLDSVEGSVEEFVAIMTRLGSHFDPRSVRAVEYKGGTKVVGVDDPGFVRAWANQLITLHYDPLARIAAGWNPKGLDEIMETGMDRESAVVSWILNTPGGKVIRDDYLRNINFRPIFSDPRALRAYLFTGKGSAAERVREYTFGNPLLLDLVAHGALANDDEILFAIGTRGMNPLAREEALASKVNRLARQLRPYRGLIPEDSKGLRLTTGAWQAPKASLDRVFNGFFHWSGRMENAWAMGPEFAYAYNGVVARMMPLLRTADREVAWANIRAAENRFRPHSETLGVARASLKAPDGPLSLEDVEVVAAREAGEHVRDLFYDATRRQKVFHSLRLAAPFAQAFWNTLSSWGRLMAQRPYIMERVGQIGVGAQEEGSGVIYDLYDTIDPFSERSSRVPNQGFVFTDPQTGEKKIKFPLFGSMLGGALSGIAGANLAEAAELAAPVERFNVAFQGDVDYLPGLGPFITVPLSQLMPDDWYGTLPDFIRRWAFPFGEPQLGTGIIESVGLPSWMRRLTGALFRDDQRAYATKDMMAYLVSTGEYPNLRNSASEQRRLVADAEKGARYMALIRAFGAAVLPASPEQDFYLQDKSGQMLAVAYLSDRYRHILNEADFDHEAATAAFVDTYGLQAIGTLVGSTEGDTLLTGPAFEFYKRDPEEVSGFTDILGDFFPGDFSFEAYTFQNELAERKRRSPQEIADEIVSYLYDAEKTMLEGRAAEQEWDDEQVSEAEDALDATYAGVIPEFTGMSAERRLALIRRALDQVEGLEDTRGGQGARLLFEAYDTYSEEAQERYGTGLRAKAATGLREEFLAEADDILANYGGMNEAEGSVDTVYRRFLSVVTPRS